MGSLSPGQGSRKESQPLPVRLGDSLTYAVGVGAPEVLTQGEDPDWEDALSFPGSH